MLPADETVGPERIPFRYRGLCHVGRRGARAPIAVDMQVLADDGCHQWQEVPLGACHEPAILSAGTLRREWRIWPVAHVLVYPSQTCLVAHMCVDKRSSNLDEIRLVYDHDAPLILRMARSLSGVSG